MWMITYLTQSVHGDIHETTISEMSPLEFTLVMNHPKVAFNAEDNEHNISELNSVHVVNAYRLSDNDLKVLDEYIEKDYKCYEKT